MRIMETIIVIGAGIAGASTAYHLSKYGADVILADREEPGQATGAAAGIVCPWLSQRRNKAWYLLAKNGARYYPELISQLEADGETETGYAKTGAISLHSEEKKIMKMEEMAIKRKADAPEIGEISRLSPFETSALFPGLSDHFYGLHVTGGAKVDGGKICSALIQAAVRNGASYLTGDARLLFTDHQVTGAVIGGETIRAEKVIVCAGAWASQLLAPLGIRFNVTFQKAQIVHLEHTEKKTDNWPVLLPPGTQYLVPFSNGRIAAGTTHEDTLSFEPGPTAAGIHEVLGKVMETAPGLKNSQFAEAKYGYRPFTEGFLPVFGALPGWRGLFAVNGLGSSGLTMGPYIGAELAKLTLGMDSDLDLGPYSPAITIESY